MAAPHFRFGIIGWPAVLITRHPHTQFTMAEREQKTRWHGHICSRYGIAHTNCCCYRCTSVTLSGVQQVPSICSRNEWGQSWAGMMRTSCPSGEWVLAQLVSLRMAPRLCLHDHFLLFGRIFIISCIMWSYLRRTVWEMSPLLAHIFH